MFDTLMEINRRPAPFETMTTEELWGDPHLSSKMLEYHLDGSVDIASRRTEFLDRSARWMILQFGLQAGVSVADFGCGPGLYTSRLAVSGAEVTGIDFSSRSLDYARQQAERQEHMINYVYANYLDVELNKQFDLITMIMCDYCALSPAQRRTLLSQFLRHLKPGGHVLLDVYSLAAFSERAECSIYAADLLDGFFSPDQYFGFKTTFKYERERVMLDKYTIIEPTKSRVLYNWLQYFDRESLGREFLDAGFHVETFLSDVAGTPFDADAPEFAITAQKPG